jgi:hypothetical protein
VTAGVPEKLAFVFEHIPEGRDREVYAARPLLVVPVADLPWAHHPFRCPYSAEFEAAVPEPLVPPGRGTPERVYEFSEAARHPYIAAFALSLTAEQLHRCAYHRPNWKWAAAAAVAAFERGIVPEPGEISQAVRVAGESDETAEAMWSFWREPIFLNGPLLGNGQHRMCALKLAGVRRYVIEP